jgi:N-sulfoglucosamine sulfohydrolase
MQTILVDYLAFRRTFFLVGLLALASVLFASETLAAQRNVILCVADDFSPDMGVYGNAVIKTPNLDALAKDGTLFTHAFCTTASCSASRSVILTGLHNHANGHYGHQHHYHKFSSYENILSLPVYLARAGYRTARCGKYHVAPEQVYQFQQVISANERNPVAMANSCQDFIEQQRDNPFFLYFCTADPHRGGGVNPDVPEQPDRFGNPLGRNFLYPGVKEIVYQPGDVIVPGFLPDTPPCRAELAQYYQSASRVDQGIGRLIEILKATNQWDHTLLLFISDHGIAMPGAKTTLYDGGMHSPCLVRNPYNKRRGVTCSAMISWVDLVPTILDFASVYDAKTQRVDAKVLPSVARTPNPELQQHTRDTRPGELHGRSFLGLLEKESAPGWDNVFASHTFHEIQMYYPMRVVRTRRHKLIWNIAHPLPFPFASDLWAAATWQAQFRQGLDAPYGARTVGAYIQRPKFELYDLDKDPHEGRNLADDPQHAELLKELLAKLKTFQQSTDDPWILKWQYE